MTFPISNDNDHILKMWKLKKKGLSDLSETTKVEIHSLEWNVDSLGFCPGTSNILAYKIFIVIDGQ